MSNNLTQAGIFQSDKEYKCPVRTVNDLRKLVDAANIQRHRYVKQTLDSFCADNCNKIIGIYGLRRTGKSVLMQSKALELIEQGRRIAYFDFELNRRAKFDWLIADLQLCKEDGIEFVFIDEITFLHEKTSADLTGDEYIVPEFPERGMELYAHFAQCHGKIILSGTDSYSLSIAKGSSLFDRMKFIHTTHIPYREYQNLIGPVTILEYRNHGGVLPRADMNWDEYVETAIINNVLYSTEAITVARSKHLYLTRLRRDEIKSLILYALAMTNIEFVEGLYRRKFNYIDLSDEIDLSGKSENPIDFPKEFVEDVRSEIKRRMALSHIESEQLGYYLAEMENILHSLDVIVPYTLETITYSRGKPVIHSSIVYALNISGLRKYQLAKTVYAIEDVINFSVTSDSKKLLTQKVRESAEGRLIESTVLAETVDRLPDDVFSITQCKSHESEIDMIVRNKRSNVLWLFEVKRSTKVVPEQVQHFHSDEIMKSYTSRYGEAKTVNYCVIYRGKTAQVEFENVEYVAVNYINIEEYLLDISKCFQLDVDDSWSDSWIFV